MKAGRGSFDFCCDGLVYVVKWHDNDIVRLGSNYLMQEPVHKVKRRFGSSLNSVTQPHLIYEYNKCMGGVDVLDKLLGSYRPKITGKKWW